jgi:hypothetical protein
MEDEQKVRELLARLGALLTGWQLWPNRLTRRDIEVLRREIDLLEYLITPRGSFKSERPYYLTSGKARCETCQAGPPLWNVSKLEGTLRWLCLQHLPTAEEQTFVIGLHGEEYVKSGRKLPKDARDK